MQSAPEAGEFVIATVKKIMPYGAFCSLDEYNGTEVFLHVSEVSSGWIRNIREHVKEGQKVVGKVIRVDPANGQIDMSIKRVAEEDRKRKMKAATNENRAEKLLERCAAKMKTDIATAQREAGKYLSDEFGDLYAAFESIAEGKVPKSPISRQWLETITEVAKAEIRQKTASTRFLLTLQSYESDGVRVITDALKKISAACESEGLQVQLHYVGAPHYYVDMTAKDYKSIEKAAAKVDALLAGSFKGDSTEYSFEEHKAA